MQNSFISSGREDSANMIDPLIVEGSTLPLACNLSGTYTKTRTGLATLSRSRDELGLNETTHRRIASHDQQILLVRSLLEMNLDLLVRMRDSFALEYPVPKLLLFQSDVDLFEKRLG